MRIVTACLGICLLSASIAPPNAQAGRYQPAASKNPVQTSSLGSERSRMESPEMLIFRRARLRAQERTYRIETRKRLGLSLLRPGPIRYWPWQRPVYPVSFVSPFQVYMIGY